MIRRMGVEKEEKPEEEAEEVVILRRFDVGFEKMVRRLVRGEA